MSLLTTGFSLAAPSLARLASRYARNRQQTTQPRTIPVSRAASSFLQSPITRAAGSVAARTLGAINPAYGALATGASAISRAATSRTGATIPVSQSAYSDPSQMSSVSGFSSPSTANTATGSYSSPYSPSTSGPYAGSSQTTASTPSNPYSDYLANEAALIQSGNKNQAIQNSQYLNGTTPTSAASIPTPASAGAASSQLSQTNLASLAQQNLAKLQEQYLSTLTPSQREQDLQNQLTQLQGSTALGVSGLEGQGRLIPLNLVRGQQGQLQEQGNIQAQTLSGQIANELANRQAQGQVYGAQLGFEQQNLDREQQTAQQAQNLQLSMLTAGYQPVDPSQVTDPSRLVQIGGQSYLAPTAESKLYEVGGNLVDQNGNVVYQGPTSGGEQYTLSPGEVRYDANGNVISSVPETPGTTGPATVQEYEYALANGYPGSFLDFISAKNAASTTQSAEMLKLQSNVQSGLDALKVIEDQIADDGSRVGGLIGSLINQQYTTAKTNLTDIIGRLRSGGAITKEEEDRFKSLIPGPIDSAANAQYKTQLLRSLLEDTLQVTGGTNTINSTQPVDTPEGRQILRNKGWTEQQINELFTNDLSTSQNGSNAQAQIATQNVNKIAARFPIGKWAGQCGHFVNQFTKLGFGDLIQTKLAKVDRSIGSSRNPPRPGDVFVMPWKKWGHTGFVQRVVPKGDGTFDLYVLDSNWKGDERVLQHVINSSKMLGYVRPTIRPDIRYS